MADFTRVGIHEEYIGLSTDTKPGPTIDTGATLAEALDNSETAIDVSNGALIAVNRSILVDAEQMYVTSISTNTLTVIRGVNGTTKAAHLNGAAIYYTNKVSVGAQAYETDTAKWFITYDGTTWVMYYGGD